MNRQCETGCFLRGTLLQASLLSALLSSLLAPPSAGQAGTTSRPQTRPGKPEDEARKQARRLVTFLELDDKRGEAANGLLKLGRNAVPLLLPVLEDPRPVVAQTAAHILRVLGSEAVAAKEQLTRLSNSDDKRLAYLARHVLLGIHPAGRTLVADYLDQKVLELDKTGKVVRALTGVKGPWDAERLPNGNYLICGYAGKKVVEMTPEGRVVWSFARLKGPYEAQRLANGNTLIADFGSGVLEVDGAGKVVWKHDKDGVFPRDAERLLNRNTLIVKSLGKRVVEVTPEGEIVWQHRHAPQTVLDADRLPNGNTLITIHSPGPVLEVTPKGKVVHELPGLENPTDADRLPNGHTLVAQQGEVAEYDGKGRKIWSVKVKWPGAAGRY